MRTTPRPPLTKRLRPGHWRAIDWFIAAGSGLILFASIRKSLVRQAVGPVLVQVYGPTRLADVLTLLLVASAVLAVALRRRRPTVMLGVLLAGSVVEGVLAGPSTGAFAFFGPIGYVLYLIAATYERKQAAARVLGAVVITLIIDELLLNVAGAGDPFSGGPSPAVNVLIPAVLCVVIAWSAGYIVRQRRRYSIGLQEEAASKAVAEERLRIARELHDVVAHSMSVIAVQAGYGQYVIDTQPEDARTALGAIQTTSREALDEMRRMLGALRQADEAAQARAEEARAKAASETTETSGSGQAGEAAGLGGERNDWSTVGYPRSEGGNPRPEGEYPADSLDEATADLLRRAPPDLLGEADAGPETAAEAGAAKSDTDASRPYYALGALISLFRQGGSMSTAPSPVDSIDNAAAPLFPSPRLDDLDRLLNRTAGAGVRVALRRRGTPRVLLPSIDLSAYRIIQEALTNVVKHAHASRCEVVIDYGATELTIRVTDSGAGMPTPTLTGATSASGGPTTAVGRGLATVTAATRHGLLADPLPGGHGIIGMRERVSLLGGQFSAGPLPGYGFEVVARIPLPSSAA